ncbi:MAG: hypothetical protein ABJA75_21870 [Bradyrhizobium sp.]
MMIYAIATQSNGPIHSRRLPLHTLQFPFVEDLSLRKRKLKRRIRLDMGLVRL